MSGRKKVSINQRFEEKYIPEPNSGCWLWTALVIGRGYGYFRLNTKKNILAHRFSWELRNGNIPDGLQVLHKCDNPACVNPDHLFLGTPQDNTNDMINKQRQIKGEDCHNALLTDEKVLSIVKDDRPNKVIAKSYGVPYNVVYRIKKGERWNWLTGIK